MRWGSMAGVAAACAYVVGDVLLLGAKVDKRAHPLLRRPGVDHSVGAMLPHSSRRLRAGALVGVLATPLYLLGVRDQRRGLAGPRVDGGSIDARDRRTASVAAGLAACGLSLVPFVHGMFYPYGEAFKEAEEALAAGAPEAEVDALIARGNEFGDAIKVPYAVGGAALLASSALMTAHIARGRSGYPRWAAAVIPPALPVAALTALTASHVLPHPRAHALQGAGISLGLLASFAASALAPRRGPGGGR